MLAKSISTLLPGWDALKVARRMRGTLSILVLFTILSALLLVVQDQHGAQSPDDFPIPLLTPDAPKQTVAGESVVKEVASQESVRNRVLAEFLAKRYQVSQDVTLDLVGMAHAAGQQLGLDPLLIMAIIAVESRYNPIAESVAGAKGLMQIIPKYHTDKLGEFGGEKAIFDPATNILVGSRILKEYIGLTGNLSRALQMYAGALNDEQDVYTSRVMGEKQRLQQVVGRLVSRNGETKTKSVVTASSPL